MITDEMVEAACVAFAMQAVMNAEFNQVASFKTTRRAAMRAALEAAERAAWRPIEEAPKDGTIVMVFRKDQGVFCAHYVEEDWHLSSQHNPPEGDHCWFSTNGDDLTNEMPTHYRPLPKGPEE